MKELTDRFSEWFERYRRFARNLVGLGAPLMAIAAYVFGFQGLSRAVPWIGVALLLLLLFFQERIISDIKKASTEAPQPEQSVHEKNPEIDQAIVSFLQAISPQMVEAMKILGDGRATDPAKLLRRIQQTIDAEMLLGNGLKKALADRIIENLIRVTIEVYGRTEGGGH